MNFKNYIESKDTIVVNIEELLPSKSDMEVAVHSLRHGRPSTDKNPIEVYQNGDRYIVSNGHHRLLQAIIEGKDRVKIKVLPSETVVSTTGTIELDFYDGDFYGLDSSLENGWLLKRL